MHLKGLGRSDLISTLTILCLGTSACVAGESPPMPGERFAGAATLFGQHCAACHGDTGAGDGLAAPYLGSRPRDFRRENFRFTSSPSGGTATVEDLARFIRHGSPSSHMPANPQLGDRALDELARYVRELRRFGIAAEVTQTFVEEDEEVSAQELAEIVSERMRPGELLPVPPRPHDYESDPVRGEELFLEHCASCHGPRGLGDGTEELIDELGRHMRARDLSRGEYRGGRRDRDLFWRIRCGLPGTPMPALERGLVGDEEVWQLVDYVRLLAGGR